MVKRENCKRLMDLYSQVEFHQMIEKSSLLKRFSNYAGHSERFMNLYADKGQIEAMPKTLKHFEDILKPDSPRFGQNMYGSPSYGQSGANSNLITISMAPSGQMNNSETLDSASRKRKKRSSRGGGRHNEYS